MKKVERKCKCGNRQDYFIIEKGSIYQKMIITCNKCNRKRVWNE